MIYLAAPYTKHPPWLRQLFFELHCKITADLFNKGMYAFAPLVLAHPVSSRHDLPVDWKFWQEFDERLLGICTDLWVLRFPGWYQSTGVLAEIKYANKHDIPVRYVNLEEFGIKLPEGLCE